eukprot:1082716-Rhodomonas_salina.1
MPHAHESLSSCSSFFHTHPSQLTCLHLSHLTGALAWAQQLQLTGREDARLLREIQTAAERKAEKQKEREKFGVPWSHKCCTRHPSPARLSATLPACPRCCAGSTPQSEVVRATGRATQRLRTPSNPRHSARLDPPVGVRS